MIQSLCYSVSTRDIQSQSALDWTDCMKSSLEIQGADVAQLVEHRLPKPRVAGSNPVVRSIFLSCADVAQLVEQLTRNEQVVGSSPTIGSKLEAPLGITQRGFSHRCCDPWTVQQTRQWHGSKYRPLSVQTLPGVYLYWIPEWRVVGSERIILN